MHTNAYCKRCLAAVRKAVTPDGQQYPLDTGVERNGTVWVLRYEFGDPVIAMALDPDDVPSGEALRYRLHLCPDLE